MSYDLTFAKPKGKIPEEQVNPAYDALAHDEPGDLFERLPVDEILDALCEAYEVSSRRRNFPASRMAQLLPTCFTAPIDSASLFEGTPTT